MCNLVQANHAIHHFLSSRMQLVRTGIVCEVLPAPSWHMLSCWEVLTCLGMFGKCFRNVFGPKDCILEQPF